MASTLVIIPSVPAAPDGDRMLVDIKALEGLRRYADGWPGTVRCLFRRGDAAAMSYATLIDPADYPFALHIIGDDPAQHPEHLTDAAVVLAAGDNHRDLHLADALDVPVVFIIEYTLATRLRINRLNHGISLRATRSFLWNVKTEWLRRRAFRRSAGLQCNGTPAYEAYRAMTPDALLYFDTRVPGTLQITEAQLSRKLAAMQAGRPLRLAFSGRLEPMKGADDLIRVAARLKAMGVPFTFSIFGDGSLRQAMQIAIERDGLGAEVRLMGPVPFETGLVPAMIDTIDLFVCCHRQDDPSCTYMETLSCGVPIVGYDNGAFRGVAALAEIGVTVPMDDPDAAAIAIARLADDRSRLCRMAGAAATTGAQHSFDRVFALRLHHLRRIARLTPSN